MTQDSVHTDARDEGRDHSTGTRETRPWGTETVGGQPKRASPAWQRWIIPGLSILAVIAGITSFWAIRQVAESRETPPVLILDAATGPDAEPGTNDLQGFVLNPPKPAPEVPLTDHTGQPFNMASLEGKAVLLFFGYTYCPDVCPQTMNKIAAAVRELGPGMDDVQVVFVSVDPDRDTQEVLARYVDGYDIPVVGVTGTIDELESVAQDYAVRFFKEEPLDEDKPDSYTMAHPSSVFLIDPDGEIRESFMGIFTPDEVTHDLRVVLEERG